MKRTRFTRASLRAATCFTAFALLPQSTIPSPVSAGTGDGTWSIQLPSAPANAFRVGVYDSQRSRMLVVGGRYPFTYDVWANHLTSGHWQLQTTNGPTPPFRHSAVAVYDPVGDRVILFGGITPQSTPLGDLHALDLATNTWSPLSPAGTAPSARGYAAAVYDPPRQRMLLFGGGNTFDMQLYALSLSGPLEWSVVSTAGAPPSALWNHVAIYDAGRDQLVINGDVSGSGTNRTWFLSLGDFVHWTIKSGNLGNRRAHTAVYDAIGHRMIVFGGNDGTGGVESTVNEVFALDLDSRTWTQLVPAGPAISARQYHAAIYDPVRDNMVVHGGIDGDWNVISGNTWILDWGARVSVPLPDQTARLAISRAYPNPGRSGRVTIQYTLGDRSGAQLEVLDAAGRRVVAAQLSPTGEGTSGGFVISDPLAAGVYFVNIRQGTEKASRRIVVFP